MLWWFVHNAPCTSYKQHRVKANKWLLLLEVKALSFCILLGAVKKCVNLVCCSEILSHKPSSNASILFKHGKFATKCLKHKVNLFIIAKQEISETTWKNVILLVTNTYIEVSFFYQTLESFCLKQIFSESKYFGCFWSWETWHWHFDSYSDINIQI